MSISLFLEVEVGANLETVLHALDWAQPEYSDGANGLHGNVPASSAGYRFGLLEPTQAQV